MLFIYLTRELRRRYRQALVVSLGLAVGIGLVLTVTAAISGVGQAQTQVLHALYGVGTDLTVSKTATAGSGGPTHFGFAPPSGSQAGKAFSRDVLSAAGQGTLSQKTANSIRKLSGVAQVASALELTDVNIQGHFSSNPSGRGGFVKGGGSGGASPVSINTTSVTGIDVSNSNLGPITASDITSGHFLTSATAADAVVSTSYAKQQSLKAGSTVTVAGTSFTVVGLVDEPSGSSVDLFIPLGVAQKLSSLTGDVTQIYVRAADATEISKVQSEIAKLDSSATITTSADLANEVTGSLSNASTLATKLGLWLSVAVLIAAFGIASLLSIAAVSRRVREFGTLKALGWTTRRIVAQVMSESIVQGIAGGIVGIAIGFGGAALVTRLAPTLTAITGASNAPTAGTPSRGGFPGRGGGFPGRGGPADPGTHTLYLHLIAHVQTEALILAVVLAIAGGLIAGMFGGWRAASLRPAAALRRVE
ncbi:MAG TPA: ABC transporter permease [Candidatus Dormibacteraeota bacterium]|nr:ABC transporter permease [Candidatus Dormibacteraeota bacterium]